MQCCLYPKVVEELEVRRKVCGVCKKLAYEDASRVDAVQEQVIILKRERKCSSYGSLQVLMTRKCVMELAIAADANERQRISDAARAAAIALVSCGC